MKVLGGGGRPLETILIFKTTFWIQTFTQFVKYFCREKGVLNKKVKKKPLCRPLTTNIHEIEIISESIKLL